MNLSERYQHKHSLIKTNGAQKFAISVDLILLPDERILDKQANIGTESNLTITQGNCKE